MTDQPNRPATRMDITDIRDMEALGRSMFLDGVIEGLPIAKNVKLIIEQAVLFGRDEAGRSDRFYFTVRYDNIDDLTRDAVRNTVNDLFGKVGMDAVAHSITLAGMAFGFQAEKLKMKYAAIDAVLAKLLAEHKANAVKDETLDEYFGEILKIEDDLVAIEYARKVLTEDKVPMVPAKLTNFKPFVDRYSRLIMEA
jgi:cell division protein FtsB